MNELQKLEDLLSSIKIATNSLELAIIYKKALIERENSPIWTDAEKIKHKADFKAALLSFMDAWEIVRCDEDSWLDASAEPNGSAQLIKQQSEILKQMAEIFRPINQNK